MTDEGLRKALEALVEKWQYSDGKGFRGFYEDVESLLAAEPKRTGREMTDKPLNPEVSHTGVSGVELTTGMRVLVHLDDGGVFAGVVQEFENGGAVAVIMPTRDPVRDVFPRGYRLGSAHWKDLLTLLDEAQPVVEDEETRTT